MALDPNDLTLHIEAQVSAPGAQEASEQIRGAGRAADETRQSFTRLRETGGQPLIPPVNRQAPPAPTPQTVGSSNANASGVQFANDLVRQIVAERQATDQVFRNAVETVRASTRVTPTITAAELGVPAAAASAQRIASSPSTQAQQDAELARANRDDQQRAERDARLQGRSFSRVGTGQLIGPITTQEDFPESPATRAQQEAERARVNREAQQRAERDARLEGRSFSRIATGQTVRPITPQEDPGQGAGGLSSIFNLSTQSITRAGLALVGVGAGLNALVTIANRVHEELAAAVTAQVQLAQRTRETSVIYGPSSGQIQAQAAAFTSNPQTRGSEQDYLAAASALHGLASEYQLNASEIDRLTVAAGQLARIHNTELAPAVNALQGVLRGNVDAAQQYGISLTDEQGRIRGIGATYEQLVATVGRTRAEQILYQQVLQQTGTQQANSTTNTDSTAAALDRLQKASEQARQALTHLTEKPFNVIVNVTATAVENAPAAAQAVADVTPLGPLGRFLGAAAPLATRGAQVAAQGVQAAGDFARNAADTVSRIDLSGRYPQIRPPARPAPTDAETGAQATAADATKGATAAITEQLSAMDRLSLKIQGDLIPALQRLASTQQEISGLGSIGQALQGPDALTGGDLPRRAAAQAAQDVLAQQRLRDAQQQDAVVAEAGQADPNEFTRRQTARLAELQAGQAQQFAQRAQAGVQAGVGALDIVDQQRQLDAAGQLASLRSETLDREGAIVDLQRQEADLADRERVAARENLDLLQQQTQARLNSLQAANRLNDLQYAQQHDTLAIQAIRADVRSGALDPSALGQVPGLRQQVRAERLAEPRAEFNALEAGRPAELAGRAVQQDQLQRALTSIPLQGQQRSLEDQLTPLQQAQRLTDERTQALNRQLELARLAEEPQRTTAERNLLAATAVALAADQSVRSAQEWSAQIHDGLTDLERAWTLVSNLPIAPNGPSATGPNPTPDRIGTAAASGGDSYSVSIQVGGSNASPEQISQAVIDALTRRAQRAPRAAPRTLVGAR